MHSDEETKKSQNLRENDRNQINSSPNKNIEERAFQENGSDSIGH